MPREKLLSEKLILRDRSEAKLCEKKLSFWGNVMSMFVDKTKSNFGEDVDQIVGKNKA